MNALQNGLFGTLATKRICSAVLLKCRKARIEPLFELNRTAASVASSNNGMPTFSTPSTQKKSCRMLEGEKKNLQAHTRKKNFIMNQGVEKKFHDQTKSPTPPPPPPQKSNGRPLSGSFIVIASINTFYKIAISNNAYFVTLRHERKDINLAY